MERLIKIGGVKRVNAKQIGVSRLGLGFEKLDRDVFDPSGAYDYVAELGVKWIRIQSGWQRTEKSEGVYDFSWLDDIVDNLLKRGLTPWLCLCYGNQLYDPAAATHFGAIGYPPIKNDLQKAAWHRYVAAVTERYRGRIEWFEIWNEPDGQWCWKHGVSGTEYGEFVKDTARAIREGNPEAKVIGGSTCLRRLDWLNDVLRTGAASVMDALTYHAYTPDEEDIHVRIRALRALCRRFNPELKLIQGETGAQSRSGGAGALRRGCWTPAKQAKCLLRHMMTDLGEGVMFASYFSCVDMNEAGGLTGAEVTYRQFGYFGVLAAEFDASGRATGGYRPKPSYRALQVLAAVLREEVEPCKLPILVKQLESERLFRLEDAPSSVSVQGFSRASGAAAFAFWKPTELMTTSYEATVSLEVAALDRPIRLIDLMDGSIYELPEAMIEDNGRGTWNLNSVPLRDYPLLLTFGDFLLENDK